MLTIAMNIYHEFDYLIYNTVQKTLESKGHNSAVSSKDSNIHSFEPSGFTYDHHLNPTKSLPVTFLTV